jgi:hypothetical protein
MKKKMLGSHCPVFLLIAAGIFTFLRQRSPANSSAGLENLLRPINLVIGSSSSIRCWQKRLLTRIPGYKSGESIQSGTNAGSEVEMIKIKDTLYNKDPFSKEWIKFSDVSVAQKVFLVELDPLATLQLKEIGEVMFKGVEEVDGKKCWVYTLKPSIQNQMIERFWSGSNIHVCNQNQ